VASKVITILRRYYLLATLAGLAILALATSGAAPSPFLLALRALFGLVFVLFLPGYTLQAAFFPRQADLDTPARLALSFGLSLAVIPLAALLLNYLPWGIRLWPILAAESLLVLIFSSVAAMRRRRLPAGSASPTGGWPGLKSWLASLDRGEQSTVVILVFTVFAGLLAAAAILLWPNPAKFYTEFFMLGPGNLAEHYPFDPRLGDELSVTLGIANHEATVENYRVVVNVVNPAMPGPKQVAAAGPFTLQPGETAENPIHWQMPSAGQDQTVEFLLLMDGSADPYRRLSLLVNVIGR